MQASRDLPLPPIYYVRQTKPTTMEMPELIRYVDDFMRRAIATGLGITKKQLQGSTDLREKIEHFLVTVKAIAATPTNDDAVAALLQLAKEPTSRNAVICDVNHCYEVLNPVIAGFEHLLDMHRRKMEPKIIWDYLRSRVSISNEFEDDWLRSADAWIIRGEVIHVPLGTAKITFL
jgi:hypothetical protein